MFGVEGMSVVVGVEGPPREMYTVVVTVRKGHVAGA